MILWLRDLKDGVIPPSKSVDIISIFCENNFDVQLLKNSLQKLAIESLASLKCLLGFLKEYRKNDGNDTKFNDICSVFGNAIFRLPSNTEPQFSAEQLANSISQMTDKFDHLFAHKE